MSALPRILDVDEFPLPELCAARLDGELFSIAGAWAPVDVVVTPADRAVAAAVGVPRRWIAALGTAAWIWGARTEAPCPPTFCAEIDDRGPRSRHGVILRQVVIRRSEIALVGGMRVTTPTRTLVDLARDADWDPDEARRLQELGAIDVPTLADLAERVRRVSYGVRAGERLAALSRS